MTLRSLRYLAAPGRSTTYYLCDNRKLRVESSQNTHTPNQANSENVILSFCGKLLPHGHLAE
jgi:hypothetical protein